MTATCSRPSRGGGYSLGGEQSGHIIFRDLATTGDGLLTAILLLDLSRRAGRPLAELAAEAMTHLPQVLVNVRVAAPVPDVADLLAHEIDAVQAELGDDGRVLLRPSGTEPVVRVMVEATEGPSRLMPPTGSPQRWPHSPESVPDPVRSPPDRCSTRIGTSALLASDVVPSPGTFGQRQRVEQHVRDHRGRPPAIGS